MKLKKNKQQKIKFEKMEAKIPLLPTKYQVMSILLSSTLLSFMDLKDRSSTHTIACLPISFDDSL